MPLVHRRRVATGTNVTAVVCAITLLLAGLGSVVVAQAAWAASPPTNYPPIGLPYAQGTKEVLQAGPRQNRFPHVRLLRPVQRPRLRAGRAGNELSRHGSRSRRRPGWPRSLHPRAGLHSNDDGRIVQWLVDGLLPPHQHPGHNRRHRIRGDVDRRPRANKGGGPSLRRVVGLAARPLLREVRAPDVQQVLRRGCVHQYFVRRRPGRCGPRRLADRFHEHHRVHEVPGDRRAEVPTIGTGYELRGYASPQPRAGRVQRGLDEEVYRPALRRAPGSPTASRRGGRWPLGTRRRPCFQVGAALAFFNGGSPWGLSACLGTAGGFSDCFLTGWKVTGSPAAAALPSGEALAFFNGGSTRGLSSCVATSGFSNCFSTGWAVASGNPAAAALPGGYALAFFNGGSTRGLSACGANGGGSSTATRRGGRWPPGTRRRRHFQTVTRSAFFNGGRPEVCRPASRRAPGSPTASRRGGRSPEPRPRRCCPMGTQWCSSTEVRREVCRRVWERAPDSPTASRRGGR